MALSALFACRSPGNLLMCRWIFLILLLIFRFTSLYPVHHALLRPYLLFFAAVDGIILSSHPAKLNSIGHPQPQHSMWMINTPSSVNRILNLLYLQSGQLPTHSNGTRGTTVLSFGISLSKVCLPLSFHCLHYAI